MLALEFLAALPVCDTKHGLELRISWKSAKMDPVPHPKMPGADQPTQWDRSRVDSLMEIKGHSKRSWCSDGLIANHAEKLPTGLFFIAMHPLFSTWALSVERRPKRLAIQLDSRISLTA